MGAFPLVWISWSVFHGRVESGGKLWWGMKYILGTEADKFVLINFAPVLVLITRNKWWENLWWIAVLGGTGTPGWGGPFENHDFWRSCIRQRHPVWTDCATGTYLPWCHLSLSSVCILEGQHTSKLIIHSTAENPYLCARLFPPMCLTLVVPVVQSERCHINPFCKKLCSDLSGMKS